MAIIGLKDLHYAIIEEEDENKTVYGEVKRLGPARAFNIAPTINTADLRADDAPLFSDTAKGPATITLNTAYLESEVEADLLGKTVDERGGIVDSGTDDAPYVAVGGRAEDARGGYQWFWVYRIKFAPSEENKETKEDTPAYQTPSLTGQALPRINDQLERYKLWDGDVEDKTIFDEWFDEVVEPEETDEVVEPEETPEP